MNRPHQLAVDPHRVADGAVDLGEERVAQPAIAVVLVDGDVDQRVARDLEDRAVDPLALRVADQVGDPRRIAPLGADRRLRFESQLGGVGCGLARFDRRRRAEQVGDIEADQRGDDDDCGPNDRKPCRQRTHLALPTALAAHQASPLPTIVQRQAAGKGFRCQSTLGDGPALHRACKPPFRGGAERARDYDDRHDPAPAPVGLAGPDGFNSHG